jgi:hypothetical protein
MGLDMFAYKTKRKFKSEVDFTEADSDKEIMYWRKHPNLHGWMENLYREKGGEKEDFNCAPVELTKKDLASLKKAVKEGDLPHTDGFFFGESMGTEEEVEIDLEFIKEAESAIKKGYRIYYSSWW